MAVAKKRKPDSEELIELNDGQVVNLTIKRGNLTQGDREANQELFTNMNLAQARLETLKKRSVEATTDGDFQRHMKEYKNFLQKLKEMQGQIDRFIITVIGKWDMCLSEEDEEAGVFVPLTLAGVAQLDEALRMDIFLKLIDLFGRGEEEKKDSFATFSAATVTQTENSEAPPASSLVT